MVAEFIVPFMILRIALLVFAVLGIVLILLPESSSGVLTPFNRAVAGLALLAGIAHIVIHWMSDRKFDSSPFLPAEFIPFGLFQSFPPDWCFACETLLIVLLVSSLFISTRRLKTLYKYWIFWSVIFILGPFFQYSTSNGLADSWTATNIVFKLPLALLCLILFIWGWMIIRRKSTSN